MIRLPLLAVCIALAMGQIASAQVGPGEAPTPMRYAGEIFAEACAKTHPSFRRSGRVLEANGFVKAPTGTYYHPDFNLSLKPTPRAACSIVAAFEGPDEDAVLAFGNAVTARAGHLSINVDLDLRKPGNGKTYFFAVTKPN